MNITGILAFILIIVLVIIVTNNDSSNQTVIDVNTPQTCIDFDCSNSLNNIADNAENIQCPVIEGCSSNICCTTEVNGDCIGAWSECNSNCQEKYDEI